MAAAEEAAAAAAAAAAASEGAAQARATQARATVAEEMAREEAEAAAAAAGGGGEGEESREGRPDDSDRPEEAQAALAAWRLRELRRATRDLEARSAAASEAAETARRRGLGDEERAREDALLQAQGLRPARGGGGGGGGGQVVRYHHRGAFYMDEGSLGSGDVRQRATADAPTESEAAALRLDRSALPEALRVKPHLVGKRGQTKYKGLAEEDTSMPSRGREGGGAGGAPAW